MELLLSLMRTLLTFYMSQVRQVRGVRDLALQQISGLVRALVRLPPITQLRAMPGLLSGGIANLQELSRILIQLIINTTPLYEMMEMPSEQELLDFLNQEEPSGESNLRGSSNSLFLKAMDGRPRRRKSLYNRSRKETNRSSDPSNSSQAAPATASTPLPANGRKGSLKHSGGQLEPDNMPGPNSNAARRPSAAEALLVPIIQLVSQSQRALEYLSSSPNQEESKPQADGSTEH